MGSAPAQSVCARGEVRAQQEVSGREGGAQHTGQQPMMQQQGGLVGRGASSAQASSRLQKCSPGALSTLCLGCASKHCFAAHHRHGCVLRTTMHRGTPCLGGAPRRCLGDPLWTGGAGRLVGSVCSAPCVFCVVQQRACLTGGCRQRPFRVVAGAVVGVGGGRDRAVRGRVAEGCCCGCSGWWCVSQDPTQ